MNIVWEDSYALVVNKPSGLLTTSARGVESLENRLLEFLQTRDGNQAAFIGLPHRIDRPVSGALLVAKTRQATKQFCAQFQSRKIEKTYLAVVHGNVPETSGTWEDWMRKIPDHAEAEIVPQQHLDAKRGVLHFQTIGRTETLTCLRIQLETGRTHQIRLQTSHHGFPIIGDKLYGSEQDFGPQSIDPRQQAIALHALKIVFRHPKTGKPTEVTIPTPEYWTTLGFDDLLTMA